MDDFLPKFNPKKPTRLEQKSGEISTPCEFCKELVTWHHPDEYNDAWLGHYLQCSVTGKFAKIMFSSMRTEMHHYVKEAFAKILVPES